MQACRRAEPGEGTWAAAAAVLAPGQGVGGHAASHWRPVASTLRDPGAGWSRPAAGNMGETYTEKGTRGGWACEGRPGAVGLSSQEDAAVATRAGVWGGVLGQLGQPWEARGGLWSGPGAGRSPQTSSRTQVHASQGKAGAPEHAPLEGGFWREPWQRAAFAGTPGTNVTPRRPGSPPHAHHGLRWGGWPILLEGRCAWWRCPPAAQTEGPGLCWREGTSEGTSANLAVVGRRCRFKRLGPGLGRSARLSREALTPQGTGSWIPTVAAVPCTAALPLLSPAQGFRLTWD